LKNVPNATATRLAGDAALPVECSLLDFWQWAFSDQCDDDLKGVFAEWMVANLLQLPLKQTRRVSWADSDIILPNKLRIEVKASACWQSWKLVNEDGSRKPIPQPAVLASQRVRFGGLRAKGAVTPGPPGETRFKSDVYVFCMHTQTDATAWDAWNLAHWEFYVMTRAELESHGIGKGITLAALRRIRGPMSARQFQRYMERFAS
jgi:hypothetical protein